MKIPFNWLSDFVDLKDISLESLAEELNLKAFEVEDIELIGNAINGSLRAGKILEITKHPNADKLQITQVQISSSKEDIKQIVCGANNIKVGQIVPVALSGAQVVNRLTGEPLNIKESKIRDVFSQGMLCSSGELGLEAESDGIFILPETMPLGIDLIEELKLKPQAVLNVASRSNRGDALCLQGIARETAVSLGRELKIDYYKQNLNIQFDDLMKNLPELKILDFTNCAEIGFLQIDNIQIAPSPAWLSEKLKLAGISSINNIVDITNYIMLELGQPMHSYDSQFIDLQNGLSVRIAKDDEILETLDNQLCKLNSKNTLIADSKKVLSLAGVMGGLPTSIQNNTQNILLEAACFVPSAIRLSSRSSGISTESSRRFERGIDSNLVKMALMKAYTLISELAGGKLKAFAWGENKALKEQINQKTQIDLNLKDFEKLISLPIESAEAKSILENLGFEVQIKNNSEITVLVPSFRLNDIKRPIDLIEELARFKGLNEIPFNPLNGVSQLLKMDKALLNMKRALIAQGYSETISSSLVELSQKEENDLNNSIIQMKNPLSQDHASLRTSLIEGLFKAVSNHFRRQNIQIRLFEIGKSYFADKANTAINPKETNTQEILNLSLILSSKNQNTNWQGQTNTSADFYELKGIIENLTKNKFNFLPSNSFKTDIKQIKQIEENLHPNIKAYIQFNGKIIGLFGQIHPLIAEKNNIPKNTFIAEIILEPLLKPSKFKIKKLNDNPVLQRDFTIDINNDNSQITYSGIEEIIKKNKLDHLQNISLLSLYKAQNQTSLSYRLCFQGEQNENLSSEIINKQIQSLKENIQIKFPLASFRE